MITYWESFVIAFWVYFYTLWLKIDVPCFTWQTTIDILLLGCCTRFSCPLMKYNSQLAKLMMSSINSFYPIPSPPNGWTNWPINEFHISKLNRRQIFRCEYSHVYPISIHTTLSIEIKIHVHCHVHLLCNPQIFLYLSRESNLQFFQRRRDESIGVKKR